MAIGKGPVGSEKATALLAQLEMQLDRMQGKFRMYFNGFEKFAPMAEFEQLKRSFRELQEQQFSTGQSRFKAQNLLARWRLMRSTWERDLQRMEDGTFKPGAAAAARKNPKDLKLVDD